MFGLTVAEKNDQDSHKTSFTNNMAFIYVYDTVLF